jgi:titin
LTDGGTPIIGYRVMRSDELIEITINVPPGTTDLTDEEIEAGMDYEYAITAYNIVGESIPTAPIPATPVSEPSSPMNLTLRAGDGFVDISWKEPEMDGGMMIREYNIYRGISGAAPTLLKNMGANVKKYNDTTVHNGLSYAYYVVAVNLIGESPATEMKEAIPMTLPGTPMNFIATPAHRMVSMEWEMPVNDGGSEITGYRIRKTVGEEDPEFIDLDGFEYTDTDVEDGTTYTYSICSINSVGISPWSKEVQVTPAEPPFAPTIYLVSQGSDHIHVGWTEPEFNGGMDILSFDLYKGNDHDDLTLYKTFSPDTLHFNDTNVITGEEYYYEISAVNAIGSSQRLEQLVISPIGAPSEPVDMTLELGDLQVRISWRQPVNDGGDMITGYTVHRTEIGTMATSSYLVVGDDLEYFDTSVLPGITYEYRVTATNSVGSSLPTEGKEITAYRAPDMISGLKAERRDAGIELIWDPVDLTETGDVTIEVLRSVDGGEFLIIAMLDGTVSTFSDDNTRDGAEYVYKVIARNDAGTSESSEEVKVSLKSSSSSGISGGGMAIMIIGTLIPLLVAVVVFFLLFRSRKQEEEPEAEGDVPVMEEPVPPEVTGSVLPPAAPAPQPEPAPIQQLIEEAPLPQEVPIEHAPASEEPQAPVPEEIPLQEAPNQFMGEPQEEPVSEHEDFFREVME